MKELDTLDKKGHLEEVEDDRSMPFSLTANRKYEHNPFIADSHLNETSEINENKKQK